MKKLLITILCLMITSIAHADFQSKIVEITTPATTGNQTITGVGFQPKAMVCLGGFNTVAGTTTSAAIGITFAASTSPTTNGTQYSTFNTDDSSSYRRSIASSTMLYVSSAGALLASSTLVQFTSDGAIFNWNRVDGNRYLTSCTFYGGSDITNAKVVSFVAPTSGPAAITNTDVGFQADVIFAQNVALSNTPPWTNTNYMWNFGVAARSGTTTQMGMAGYESSPTYSRVQDSSVFLGIATNSEIVNGYIKSFDATGFTAYFASSTQHIMTALAIQGGNWTTGKFNQNTSSGTQTITGLGSYTPSSLFLGSINNASTPTPQVNQRNSLSMCTAGEKAYLFEGQNGQSSYVGVYGTSTALRLLTPTTNGVATTQSVISCSSFANGSFTLNNSGSDAGSTEIFYLAAGANFYATPTLLTPTFSSVTSTGATASSSISATGGVNATLEGFAWGTDTSYFLGTTSSSGSFGVSDFSNATTTLTCGTTYHVRAYATNTGGTGYSSDGSFSTTACAVVSTLTTSAISPFATSTATFPGAITATGGANATESGFVYGLNSNFRTPIATTTLGAQTGTATFSQIIGGLTNNTLYYVRSYATNSAGTAYGSTQSFTTNAVSVPTLTTSSASSLTTTSATLNGNMTDDGYASSTVRGFNYGTSVSYGLSTSTAGAYGIGSYSQTITGLSCGTGYHFQASSTNEAGAGVSTDNTFTTSACSVTATPTATVAGNGAPGGLSSGAGGLNNTIPTPRYQIVYPDGRVVYLDNPNTTTTATVTTTTTGGSVSGNPPQNFPTLTTPPSFFTKSLSFGSESPSVATLQTYLASDKTLYPIGLVTGYFGSLTKAAVTKFQLKYNVIKSAKDPGAGNFGPKTRAKLSKLLK